MHQVMFAFALIPTLLWPSALVAGDLVVDGLIESKNAGFRFPDGSVQTTAVTSSNPLTPISFLPFDITESGSYFLTGNLSLDSGLHGISVSADDVTIDLNGFVVSGAGTTGNGIQIDGADDLVILNGTITEFGQHGIGGSGDRTQILQVRLLDNGSFGVSLDLFDNGQVVRDCTISGNAGGGVSLGESSTVAHSVVTANGNTGVRVQERSTVMFNTLDANGGEGINADDQSAIIGNMVSNNLETGIRAENGSRVVDNTVIHNNTGEDVDKAGIRAFSKSHIARNHLENNRQNGLLIEDDGNVITGNTTISNSGNGLRIDDARNIYVDNRSCQNTDDMDIVPGNLDGGGNLECP